MFSGPFNVERALAYALFLNYKGIKVINSVNLLGVL